jgi:hypothetical protein
MRSPPRRPPADEDARRTLADIIRRDIPTTVLCVLLEFNPERRGLTAGTIAQHLGFSRRCTSEVLQSLRDEYLVGDNPTGVLSFEDEAKKPADLLLDETDRKRRQRVLREQPLA